MRDSFAPETPYDNFDVSTNAPPSEIEQAYDSFVENNPGQEIEATLKWDELRQPEKRLMIDIFQYQVSAEIVPKDDFTSDDFTFELPPIESEGIKQLEERLMNELIEQGKKIDFGKAKTILDLDLEQ